MARTLGELCAMVRRRLGWPESDAFVSEAELSEMIKESRQELFDLLISVHQGDYLALSSTFTTTAGSGTYIIGPDNPASVGGVPSILMDMARIRRVAVIFDNISYPMRRWDVETDVMRTDSVVWDSGTDIRYRVVGGIGAGREKLLLFNPTPAGTYTVEVWGNLGLANSTFSVSDALNLLGNDEYLVLDGMIKCLQMEESDTSVVERQKARYIQMLENNATPVDAGRPETIHDARGASWDRERFGRY